MTESKLLPLTVMLIGAFACGVNHGLVGINHADSGSPDSAASSGGDTTPQGVFATTAVMIVAREYHSATLLPNGKVLIAGGDRYTGVDYVDLGSAELYEPDPRWLFVATGSMIMPRARHTATLLRNGRVLIAGGSASIGGGGYAALASAELYDPSNGTFTATASMSLARCAHTATLLGNGKVLVTAGFDGAIGDHANAELYDPDFGTFAPTGKMLQSRAWHTATLLGNGKVLIAGGAVQDPQASASASAELYDPNAETFTATGSMTMPRAAHTATLLEDGKVLIAGNLNSQSFSAELYDPAYGKFVATADATVRRWDATATLLPDGLVLITGGQGYSALSLAIAELYDPSAGRFSAIRGMSVDREGHTATLLGNGTVLIAGGHFSTWSGFVTLASAELYEYE